MSTYREQAHIDASLEEVWDLLGDPRRHPEWWPRVIEVSGQTFDEGDQYVQVSRKPFGGQIQTFMAIDRLDDLREIGMTCQTTGTYARWVLTEAQGGTFVEAEVGMQPGHGLGYRVFDFAVGPMYFRRWVAQSVDGLRNVVTQA